MIVLTIIDTVLLVLALIYIVALLRSHADILRRLALVESGAGNQAPANGPPADGRAVAQASDVAGNTLSGDAVKLSLGAGSPETLLAFLTSGCASCGPFWAGLQDRERLAGIDERVVVITHDMTRESASRLRELAPAGVEVIMASDAWAAYAVPSSPHFVLTDGHGGIAGRGSAPGWEQLLAMVGEARGDVREAVAGAARTTAERAERAERVLARAGIGPGHPSLYPGTSADANGDVS